MEAEPVDDLPRSKDWLYEPKYEGSAALPSAMATGLICDPRTRNR